MTRAAKTTARREPWHPAVYEIADAGAIQALYRGDATPEQQKRALKWLIEGAAATYEASFDPVNDRVTSYMEGKRSVGNQIVKLCKLNLNELRKDGRIAE